MVSFDPESFDPTRPPPRPTTPPIRRGFLRVLGILLVITALAYGIPYMLDRAGYAWESGRSRAASEALAKLDKDDVIGRSSYLFRMATRAITPAVVNIKSLVPQAGGFGEEMGSGVIIDKDNGYIVTNEHVVHGAEQIVVRIGRANDVEGTLIGVDARTDLAVIQVKGPVGVAAEWGDSEKMEVGDWVIAVGSPFGLERTVTVGIVSATNRHGLMRGDRYEDFIQTDAAINPGNSGGPLINLKGQVIGINTAIIRPPHEREADAGLGATGIGMAISSDIARPVVAQIIKNGKVVRSYLGIVPGPVSPALARDLGLPEEQGGALVHEVSRRQPGGEGRPAAWRRRRPARQQGRRGPEQAPDPGLHAAHRVESAGRVLPGREEAVGRRDHRAHARARGGEPAEPRLRRGRPPGRFRAGSPRRTGYSRQRRPGGGPPRGHEGARRRPAADPQPRRVRRGPRRPRRAPGPAARRRHA